MLLLGLVVIPSAASAFTTGDDEVTVPGRNWRGWFTADDIYSGIEVNQWGIYGGIHSGQLLNSSYSQLIDNGVMKKKLGYSVAVYKIYYPLIAEAELSAYRCVIGDKKQRVGGISAFLSYALFPWHYLDSDVFVFMPNIGIGVQQSDFGAIWAPEPANRYSFVYQAMYKLGFVMDILINERNDRHMVIIGNYYSSLSKKDNPHALNAFSLGIGFSINSED